MVTTPTAIQGRGALRGGVPPLITTPRLAVGRGKNSQQCIDGGDCEKTDSGGLDRPEWGSSSLHRSTSPFALYCECPILQWWPSGKYNTTNVKSHVVTALESNYGALNVLIHLKANPVHCFETVVA
jgi:hypothetical protein